MSYRKDKVKIIWISRHRLNRRNKEILNRAFGKWEVVEWVQGNVDEAKLKALAEKHRDAKFVVVLPLHLLRALLNYTNEVYRFLTERKMNRNRIVRFIPYGLEKVEKIEVKTKRIV